MQRSEIAVAVSRLIAETRAISPRADGPWLRASVPSGPTTEHRPVALLHANRRFLGAALFVVNTFLSQQPGRGAAKARSRGPAAHGTEPVKQRSRETAAAISIQRPGIAVAVSRLMAKTRARSPRADGPWLRASVPPGPTTVAVLAGHPSVFHETARIKKLRGASPLAVVR